jgi:acyl-coenzyme A thioesterase PaaI-like protein
MEGRALQDVIRGHCFGCGALNDVGLQIKSHWDNDELVCRFQPKPFHIGHPGIVYGGIIASVIDCHSIWTAMATAARNEGLDMDAGPLPFGFVTAKLEVNYLRPAAIGQVLDLRARVVERSARRFNVQCQVLQDGQACATGAVVTVRVTNPTGA